VKKAEEFGRSSSFFKGRENELNISSSFFGQPFFQSFAVSQQSFFTGYGRPANFHPGLDMRALSQRIKDLKLAGRSIEEIAKEIDPKEFEDMWR